MKKIHEKSPCCQGSIWRRGERRRQCSICGKTWRSWIKKTGRKRKKADFDLLFKYLKKEIGSLNKMAIKKQIDASSVSIRMSNTVKKFNETTKWPNFPEGDLVLIADAMIQSIDKIPYTFYFLLLRSTKQNKAVIAPFSVGKIDRESWNGWYSAIHSLPNETLSKIKVLVCDGNSSLLRIGKDKGWLIQRCQFHLRARISHYCSPRRFGKRPSFAKKLQKLVTVVLTNKNIEKVQKSLDRIQKIKDSINAKSFKTVLSGFLKNFEDYRTYLKYPEYHLPITSNSAEFLIGQIRDLQYRARGFKTLKSLSSWIESYIKFTQKITCNGKFSAPS